MSVRAVRGLRAALYSRVSTLDQEVTNARDELRMNAIARGCTIVMEVEETGSGARNDRPGWQRVMAAARRGEINVVLVWKLDRAGRSSLDLLTNINELKKCGCRFIATTQGIDIQPDGDAMSLLILTVLAAVAAFELDLIRERTKLGLERARKAGKRLGRPVATSAPDVAAIASLRASGASWSVVAKRLGCTPSAARRAVQRGSHSLAEKGVSG